MHKFIFFVLLVGVTLFTGRFADGARRWESWYPLPFPIAGLCGTVLKGGMFVLGGDGIYPKEASAITFSMDYLNPTEWSNTTWMPIELGKSGFCTAISNRIFVSRQASWDVTQSLSGSLDVYEGVLRLTRNVYGDILERWIKWKNLGSGSFPRVRGGIGVIEDFPTRGRLCPVLFGGLNPESGKFVRDITAYDGEKWIDVAHTQLIEGSLCDCSSDNYYDVLFFMCRQCNRTSGFDVDDDLSVYTVLTLNITSGDFISPTFTLNPVQTASMSRIGQYLVIIAHYTASNPRIMFYDLYLDQLHNVSTSNFNESRQGAAVFISQTSIVYAGGTDHNGTKKANINLLRAIEEVSVAVNHMNRKYQVNETLIIGTDVCSPGMILRLSTTERCSYAVPGIADRPCYLEGNRGVTSFPLAVPVEEAYICASFGYCTKNVSERTECLGWRVSMHSVFNSTSRTIEDCLDAHCCYDSERNECFSYSPLVPANKIGYFMLLSDQPVVVTMKSSWFSLDRKLTCGLTLGGVLIFFALLVIIFCPARRKQAFQPIQERQYPFEFFGKYNVLRQIGSGSFGHVFLVERQTDMKQLALKYIECKDIEERGFALKEFELLFCAQGHPNVIHLEEMFMKWGGDAHLDINGCSHVAVLPGKTHATSEALSTKSPFINHEWSNNSLEPRYVCIAMEYFPEGDLLHYVLNHTHKKRLIPEHMITHVFALQICSALHYLHTREPPIVHRDIKPENILIKNNAQEMVLADLGLAQLMNKSYMATCAGSLQYVAPECWQRRYTKTVDLWAVGCIMYGMATGRVTAQTARVMFTDAKSADFYTVIEKDLSAYSSKMRQIVIGLLQVDPTKRLTSAEVITLVRSSEC